MRALVFENSLPRLALTKILSQFSPRAFVGGLAPIQLLEIDEPTLPADDWLVLETRLCGVCGSDSKQVFMNGAIDNPMTSMISFPQVLGHEVVGVVDSVGPAVRARRVGERVVLNPWLSCATRGLPLCEWCQQGELAQCLNFTSGQLTPGIHHGNSSQATGGFAERVPAHESQCLPIPDDISDEQAVLADPFSVSLHAILHHPPSEEAGTALVYGCGTLGLLAIAILRELYPRTRVLAVARYDHQARLAEKLGAERVIAHEPAAAVVHAVAEAVGVGVHTPWRGLPMLNGGVDVVYDTVTSPGTLEVSVRIARTRGTIVALGVEPPKRFEWTPLYFKELSLVGSNAFAIEEHAGRRQHAMEWYLEWVRERRVDVTPIITHRFALDDYGNAFMTCFDQGASGAVKVLFDRFA
ncbi:MAG: alcohol dehydrogenase catalytic domain-containing protein [Deltaproteobacteria bacterium]|nr:alcohol dehydrogenase catalytic domain-containing protein [Deltaproteobacteria bacterium]MBW2383262.1 alcohol dehydrogenase catalytic domain-containing protein [Deltaproteobacteria bacterium]MBW2694996.1 alcohol dehydrogenase catalytic domain-containing protein [Deltaproteobacteria bacterium]